MATSQELSAINEAALARVRDDKLREAGDGFDGTWVAHPDLVPVAREVFEKALRGKDNQKERTREEVQALLNFYQKGRSAGSVDAGIQRALEAIFASPDFLFRIEGDPASVAPGAV